MRRIGTREQTPIPSRAPRIQKRRTPSAHISADWKSGHAQRIRSGDKAARKARNFAIQRR